MVDVLQYSRLQIDVFVNPYLYGKERRGWQYSGSSELTDNVSGLEIDNRKQGVMITYFIFPDLKGTIGKYEMI
jgi:hypothetical protein